MSTKFFTNSEENTLIKKFEGVFTYNPHIQYFDALVGYFRASGYFRIRPFLDRVPNIRILVGINVDKILADAQKSGLEFFKHDEKTREDFIKETQKDIENANYDQKTETGILQFIDDIIQGKIQVKAHPEKKIHAKVYILRPEPFNQHTPATAITGSSNLTDAGLGGGNFYNYEFNVQLTEYDDVQFATVEFEKLWAESVYILLVDIKNITKKTYLNTETTSFELYIKLLSEYFSDNINYDADSIGDLPENFKKLSYQVDAVNEGFNMLIKHNGFILADVVGLGKTVIAAMVAKRFLMENGRNNTKILVVYPPAVEKNWKNTFNYFNIDKYTKFITNGSLDKILTEHQDYWTKEEYDLVIVDEAHKFRNHKTGAFQNLQLICKSPRVNQGLIAGNQKKVILVSATPLNNRPDDIFYQIQMFQDARQSTLPITNLTAFFNPLMEQYKSLKRFEELDVNKLRRIYGEIRTKVIEPITIRRTRTDLENIIEYKLAQGIIFPQVEPPQKVEYLMDEKLNELFHKTVICLTGKEQLTYSRYQAIASLNPEIQSKYYENAETVSKSLAFIMKTQLVKRLESSFYAFKKSLTKKKEINLDILEKSSKSKESYKSWFRHLNIALDKVKICDPAIGSGAFPMGLLHEIFTAKQTLHTFEFGNTTKFNASEVKLNIIQNSIYGVDIERGAVDIARLRFWLSLIVDEPKPKALPNLDYKIVVGDSLLSNLGDDIINIDWNIDETAHGLFGQNFVKQKVILLENLSQKQKEFFSPDTNKKKLDLAEDIRNLKIDLLINQLELMVKTQWQNLNPIF